MEGIFLVVEDAECGDPPEDFLLNDRRVDVLDFDQAGPVDARERTTGCAIQSQAISLILWSPLVQRPRPCTACRLDIRSAGCRAPANGGGDLTWPEERA